MFVQPVKNFGMKASIVYKRMVMNSIGTKLVTDGLDKHIGVLSVMQQLKNLVVVHT
jgi:hypothetical protein